MYKTVYVLLNLLRFLGFWFKNEVFIVHKMSYTVQVTFHKQISLISTLFQIIQKRGEIHFL